MTRESMGPYIDDRKWWSMKVDLNTYTIRNCMVYMLSVHVCSHNRVALQ